MQDKWNSYQHCFHKPSHTVKSMHHHWREYTFPWESNKKIVITILPACLAGNHILFTDNLMTRRPVQVAPGENAIVLWYYQWFLFSKLLFLQRCILSFVKWLQGLWNWLLILICVAEGFLYTSLCPLYMCIYNINMCCLVSLTVLE